ncbi:syntaxin-7 [Neocloeon triangulifer]|uniref:syntaxin-7 n=1 Tax=Neocloeon triangulifer TaxID=2078957 RepID=UPI00286FA657|nr:syntaxin-7 [Neocloeon triangulifer]
MERKGITAGTSRVYGATEVRVPEVNFSDMSSVEIRNLSESITTNVYTINQSWKQLDEALRLLGTDRDSAGLRDTIHVGQLSTKQVVGQTTKEIQKLNFLVKRGSKPQKLQFERLQTEFKDAIKRYGQIQTQVAMKLRAHALVRPQTMEEEYEQTGDELEERAQLIAKQKQMKRDLEFEKEIMLERERRIKQIEEDVLDVNEIMRELSTMVHDQGEVVGSIEDNIERVHTDVAMGRQELEQASRYQNKRRRKLCWCASIAAVVALIIIGSIVIKFISLEPIVPPVTTPAPSTTSTLAPTTTAIQSFQ